MWDVNCVSWKTQLKLFNHRTFVKRHKITKEIVQYETTPTHLIRPKQKQGSLPLCVILWWDISLLIRDFLQNSLEKQHKQLQQAVRHSVYILDISILTNAERFQFTTFSWCLCMNYFQLKWQSKTVFSIEFHPNQWL